jgi:hypothetical protein
MRREGVVVIPQFSKNKLNLFLSFLSCSVALGFGVSGGIPQKTVDLLAFFPLGWELKGESEFGPLILIRWMGAPPPLLPNTSCPPPSPHLGCSHPPPSLALLPIGSRPLPSPWLPPPSRSPPRSKDREEEEHIELKRKRGSRRCSSPSLLEDFLGENPRYG